MESPYQVEGLTRLPPFPDVHTGCVDGAVQGAPYLILGLSRPPFPAPDMAAVSAGRAAAATALAAAI